MKTPDNAPDIKVGRKTPDEIKRGLECCKRYMGGAPDSNCDVCPYQYSCSGLYDDFLAYIRQLEAQAPKWISVEERLPETCDWVLVIGKFVPEGFWCVPNIAEYFHDSWRIKDEMCSSPEDLGIKVTHWMPLPEPPKED